MNKVVITGAGGFIGGAVTQRLLDQGVTVYGVDVSSASLERFADNKNFNPVIADFNGYNQLSEKISERDFDAFYHFAWCGYGKDTNNFDVQITNVVATHSAAEQAGRLGCKKFIMACSSHEYQLNCYNNVEGNSVGACSTYGASKTASKTYAKVVCHNANVEFNGVIFTNVFGVGDKSARTANFFISQLLKGNDLNLISGEHPYDWTYIDDVVSLVIAVGEKGVAGKEYYVGNPELRPFKDIITELRDILAPNAKLNFGAFVDTSYIDYSKINITELYEDTGVKAVTPFKDAVLKTAQWVKTLDI